jgi:hypothetical protein
VFSAFSKANDDCHYCRNSKFRFVYKDKLLSWVVAHV